jgi:hypothetical protein
MRDVITTIQFDIDEMSRIAQETLRLLSSADRSTSPIRYRSVVEDGFRLRVLWASHIRLSQQVYAYIVSRDPRFRSLLEQAEGEQLRLSEELRLLTPARWPRTTELGLNSLRTHAYNTLPSLMRQLSHEEMTVLPLLRRWVFGGAAEAATPAPDEAGFVIRRMASA